MRVVTLLRRHWLSLWQPFFERLAARHGVTLTVITPAERFRDGVITRRLTAGPDGAAFDHVSIPCYLRLHEHEAPMAYSPPLRRVIADARPDVVYVIGEAGYVCAWQALRVARALPVRPRVCLYAAQNILQPWPFPFAQIERSCLHQADMLFPIGEEHEQVARQKRYRGPATRMPLGVDHELFRPVPPVDASCLSGDDAPVVGFVGKLTRAKGVDLLLRAAARCRPVPRLLLIGAGPDEAKLRALAERLGLAAQVTWLSQVAHRDLPAWYAAMDVFVLPSRQVRRSGLYWWVPVAWKEQFGRVLVEAMACARPVIGSDSGEIPFVIGDAGLTFPENDVEELAASLANLLDDPARRRELGDRGRRRVLAHYTWDLVTRRYVQVWTELLQHPSVRERAP
jgi:glycosyltransferase involved in cell wall biosynthesis